MFLLWCILFSLLTFHILTRYSRRGRLYNKIPGPRAVPLLGNLLRFIGCDQQAAWRLIREITRKYYPIYRFWGVDQALVNIYHPDDLEVLLSSQKTIDKGYIYQYMEPWLNTGLITSTGNKWRQRRRILTPVFHFGILKKYLDVASEQGENMIESLKNEDSETVKSLIPFFSNYTLNIILEAIGVELKKFDVRELSQYKQSIHDLGNIIIYRFLRPYLIDIILPYVPKTGALQTRILEILHGFTDKVIQLRKQYHKNNGNKFLDVYNEESDGSIYVDSKVDMKKRLAMLDLLLAAEQKGLIDKAGIQEETDSFIFAGHDTTAMALTYITMLLAENKEAQNRAREEVTAIMNAENGKAGVAEVQEFHYLERCIKESLRLFPVVSIIMRHVREDVQLKHALIPANTHTLIHLWDTHRDPNFWPEPDKFDPDRFLPENSWKRHPFSYVPFSAGPRNCIGQRFAMMELKLMMARILYDFYLEPIDSTAHISIILDIVLRPGNPVHVKFVKIDK